MIEFVEKLADIICGEPKEKYSLFYELDGFHPIIYSSRNDTPGTKKLIGKLICEPNSGIITLKNKNGPTKDKLFIPWDILKHLRMCDRIETDEKLTSDGLMLARYSISVRKAVTSNDFIDLSNKGSEKFLLIPKVDTKCQIFKYSYSQKRYIPEKIKL